jgi:L-ribulose-5-phosphate 4-epimerase
VATHRLLYQQFAGIGGVSHSHSPKATAFAQAQREIPCIGTTHADHFCGPVPVTRPLTPAEIDEAYELNTGRVIVERFADLDPQTIPAALVASHGPFTWGQDAAESVRNAVALEAVAAMALDALTLEPTLEPADPCLLHKHYARKHGKDAYYGQRQNDGNSHGRH